MSARDGTGVWLYAVARSAGPGRAAGVAGEEPRTVEAAGLTAVVSDVPLASFGEDALRRNLEDLDWLAAVARAHDDVIVALAEKGPVVPIRLATVYHDDRSVLTVLRRRAADFERTLAHVSGRTEWGVKAFLEAEAEPAAVAPRGEGSGRAYLARRRSALASREKRQQAAAGEVSRLHRTLSVLAADSCTHPPQNRTLAGQDRPMVLNGAYLVDEARTGSFTEVVDSSDQDSALLSVFLTGPWPPYSFSSLEGP